MTRRSAVKCVVTSDTVDIDAFLGLKIYIIFVESGSSGASEVIMYISSLSAVPSLPSVGSVNGTGSAEVKTYQSMLNSSTHIERKLMNEEHSLSAEAMDAARVSQGTSAEISISEATQNARMARNFLF